MTNARVQNPKTINATSLKKVARCASIAGHTLRVWTQYDLHSRLQPARKRKLVDGYRKELCERVLDRFGVVIEVTDDRREGPAPGKLVVANHGSALDILIMLKLFGGVMVSRDDVAEWPVLGRLAKHGDTIFVDRADGWSGARAMRAIRRALKGNETVLMFPEGGTFHDDEVHPLSLIHI